MHVPLQSQEIKKPGEALLSPGATGNGCRAKHLHVDRQFGQNKLCLTTTYCGYLSQMDTPFLVKSWGYHPLRSVFQVALKILHLANAPELWLFAWCQSKLPQATSEVLLVRSRGWPCSKRSL